jgi:hypothetical protein
MPEVDSTDVTNLLDGELDDGVIPIITTMAKSYTRGHGFDGNEPNTELAAVITAAAARLASNTKQLRFAQTAGPYVQDFRSAFDGWTVAEMYVLNRYRKRAM